MPVDPLHDGNYVLLWGQWEGGLEDGHLQGYEVDKLQGHGATGGDNQHWHPQRGQHVADKRCADSKLICHRPQVHQWT